MLANLTMGFIRGRVVPKSGWKVLSSKFTRKLYKGKGAVRTGVHTSKGGYIQIASMLPKYIVPDLSNFSLRPYVAKYNPATYQKPAAK